MKESKDLPDTPTGIDITSLELEQETKYHWEISFDIKISKTTLTDYDLDDPALQEILGNTDEDEIWLSDTLVVESTSNSEIAIAKLKNHVFSSDYDFIPTEFLLGEIKLLSVADI